MRERKPLMKKESKTKYIVLIVLVVLALGYVAYEKLDINLKEIDLFKDKQVNEGNEIIVLNSTQEIYMLETSLDSISGTLISVLIAGISVLLIITLIFPLFKGLGVT